MDLKAVSDQNAKADRLTRAGMVFCFLLTGGILLGMLAFAPGDQQAPGGLETSALK
jgi:hypothetical protein